MERGSFSWKLGSLFLEIALYQARYACTGKIPALHAEAYVY